MAFHHTARDLACVVHGGDFTFSGEDKDLDWIEGLMKGWFEVKVRARLGPDLGDDKVVVILGRIVRWTDRGIEYEADPKHRKLILEYFGFDEGSKSLSVNGSVEEDRERDEEVLSGKEAM